ncbi:sulfonate ABC transporter permease [Sphaerisporangium krabiense]|uniref:NitT/TauT family transport system permease protein n=1 Tax=Sphaerisporangium krabiense TaxID=763782 RepID=A0A7W9DSI9_9ACTN|nr:ABC transporter permease subunit [Sphaerisporangium krabiense]MBB5629573.1 NitT/TauT family transport system permease protein [Sphaerisporangium krabiense]GII67230.1 sulfonate ABC transporter permease [Sphaerisporangium krabiense]
MTTSELDRAAARPSPPRRRAARPPAAAVFGAGVWAGVALLTVALRDRQPVTYTPVVAVLCAAVAAATLAAVALAPARARHRGPWVAAAGYWFAFWELATAKLDLLRPPYFTSPQGLAEAFWNDRALLADSFVNSLRLLVLGFAIGAASGLVAGVAMGWAPRADYWAHPILMTIGPVPGAAWLPLILVIFPTSYSGAVFMMSVSVWFPVTVLTRSGVMSVRRAYYDVAQTLGAGTRYLIWRVALPAALPQIFTGLFMGLGASFITLVIAELLGVKNGLGWYIEWTKGWAAYPRMYCAIVLMIVFCGGAMAALFRVRNRVLRWQKDLVRW